MCGIPDSHTDIHTIYAGRHCHVGDTWHMLIKYDNRIVLATRWEMSTAFATFGWEEDRDVDSLSKREL